MKRSKQYGPWCMVLALGALIACGASAQENTEGGAHVRKPPPSPKEIAALPPDGGPEYNRLVFEQSPYLLQHAANPVDWYPWGDAAFEKAKKENKPIFLSIGYSTCHWCHVMERESFENDEVAALLNQSFVAIKVDREERPDIDEVYMSVTQAMTGSGGWPMTIVMRPDKKPFFAGTYFPKQSMGGRPGMMDLLPALADAWANKRDQVDSIAEQSAGNLQLMAASKPGPALGDETLQAAYQLFTQRFDETKGGFGFAPKFPTPHNFFFLLRYWKRNGEEKALAMVEKTLTEMRRGGIYDQVGFGFHRYSTDRDWLLPHFEKMLYDQALISIAYIETYQATHKQEYARTAREIFTYVLRDMTSPEGGFYSAEDADSEGEEGKFYVWTNKEATEILGEEEGKLYGDVYNFEPNGNFTEQSTRKRMGTNIPHLEDSLEAIAKKHQMTPEQLEKRLEASRRKLFAVREKRIHPLKDDKILTDWNGLMIAALAQGARVLDAPEYADAARRAADFILGKLRDSQGRLLKRYRLGKAGLPGHLEDYAYVVWGLLELYETTFDVKYLESAIELNDMMIKHFEDKSGGGFFKAADDGESLIVRSKDIYDGARPSGNSVAALNLLRIGRITGREELGVQADRLFKAFSGQVSRGPVAFSQLMCAVDFNIGPSYEIVIAGKNGAEDSHRMLQSLRSLFAPNKVVIFRPDGESPPIAKIAEFTAPQTSLDGKATAYVCLNYACRLPTTDPDAMLSAIKP